MDWIDIARITGKKGLNGELIVQMRGSSPFLLDEGLEVALVPPQIDVPRRCIVESINSANDSVGNITLTGIDSISLADAVIGMHLLITKDSYAELKGLEGDAGACGYLADDLIGWAVIDINSGFTGLIDYADLRLDQILLSVIPLDDNRQEIKGDHALIPLVDEFIIEMDDESKEMRLDCPSGLFDL